MAGFRLTQKKAVLWSCGSASGLFIGGILCRPRRGGPQARVDGSDVRHSVGFQPFLKCLRSAADKHAYPSLPRGTSAQNAAKMHASLGRKLKSFVEHAIAHACGQEQK